MNNTNNDYLDLSPQKIFYDRVNDAPTIENDENNADEDDFKATYRNSLLNSFLVKLEYFYAYISLLFFADALSFRSYFLVGEGDAYTGFETPIDPLIGLVRYAILAFTLLIIVVRFKLIAPLLWRMRLLLLLASLPYLSHYWSDFPEFSSKFGLFVFGITLVGIYIAGRYSLKEQTELLAWVFGTMLALCLLFIVLLPGSGIEQGMHAGSWRGVFWHKNNLGTYGALSGIFFCLTAQTETKLRWRKNLYWLLASLAVLMMVMSTSKTALVVFLVSLVLLLACYILRWHDTVSIPAFLSLFVIASGVSLWLIQSFAEVLVILGKGSTLSSRTDIWSSVYYFIKERPLLGHGYAGFWVDVGEARHVWGDLGFEPVHSHNGFLDLILDLGFVGLAVFLVIFILTYGRLLRLVRRTRNIRMFWPLLFMSMFILFNIAQAQILKVSFNWLIFVIICSSTTEYYRQSINHD